MKHNFSFLFIIAVIAQSMICRGQSPATSVFKNGEDGYACYRIPAVIKTRNGDLLAFAEARKNNCSDFGDIDIVMKTSSDRGKTWSEVNVVVDNHSLKAGIQNFRWGGLSFCTTRLQPVKWMREKDRVCGRCGYHEQ